MALKLGLSDVADVRLGSSQVRAIYRGADLVWPTTPSIELVGNIGANLSWGSNASYVWNYGDLGQQEGDVAIFSISTYRGQSGYTPSCDGYTRLHGVPPTMNGTTSGHWIGWRRLAAGETSLTWRTDGGTWALASLLIAIYRNVADIVANDFSSVGSGASVSPNPPAVASALNVGRDWVHVVGCLNSFDNTMSAPTNYTRIGYRSNGSSSLGSTLAQAYRDDPAANEDPGAWGGSLTNNPTAGRGSTLVLRNG